MIDDKDEVLLRLDREQKVYELFLSYGCDEARSQVASKAVSNLFDWSGVRLSYKQADGELVTAADPSVREELSLRYDFLFPVNANAQQEQIAKSLLGVNMSDRSRLVSTLGIERANQLSRTYGLQNVWDHRPGKAPNIGMPNEAKGDGSDAKPAAGEKRSTNPWSTDGWSVDRQAALIKRLGTKASGEIAAAVGCKLTSIKPNPEYA